MLPEYDNYVFDLYGTLIDIRTDEAAPAFWRTLARCLNFRNVPCTADSLRDRYCALCAETEREAGAALAKRGLEGPAEMDILAVWRKYFAEQGKAFTEKELWDFGGLFRALSVKKLRLYPGALPLLIALRRAKKKVCLLTNAQAAFTRPELEYLGLSGCFDRIFISSEAGVRKPSPAFYALLRREGLDFSRTLMIGNDDLCDCRAAAQAGLDSLYIRTAQSPAQSGPLPENCREIAGLRQVFPFR